jgi:hypothetical protein
VARGVDSDTHSNRLIWSNQLSHPLSAEVRRAPDGDDRYGSQGEIQGSVGCPRRHRHEASTPRPGAVDGLSLLLGIGTFVRGENRVFDKILLAIDGSDHSAKATTLARQVATEFKSDVLVLHVREKFPLAAARWKPTLRMLTSRTEWQRS